MCDLTIAAADAVIFDLHYDIGSVPGDGIHSCFQELLGVKRAAYALLTGEAIDAQKALEYGMINEAVPREQLIGRAFELADHIMTQPRTIRRLTTQIVRRPWRQRITDNLDGGFGIQMFGHVAQKASVHGESYIEGTRACRLRAPGSAQQFRLTATHDGLRYPDRPATTDELRRLATQIKLDALEMISIQGFGYFGQALSAAEQFAVLFGGAMRHGHDQFVLSPGHYAVVFYAAAAERGLLDRAALAGYGADGAVLEAISTERTQEVVSHVDRSDRVCPARSG